MSKKHDFLRDEQSRQKHPDKPQVGSPAAVQEGQAGERAAAHAQQGGAGKVANDHNQAGHQAPTPTHQARRTPQSRNDRQSLGPGPQNQVSARKGGGGAGRVPRGSG
ncbi:hypothetical protein [Xenophilus sp. Marseille-Q4582]|uniref:hypothetical protein n=1 Tax=Xenophilus sp. Marseille-Q4582 TaxID=2866600 RepID=UPI001CE42773|nr:hypothetical protein [Xenophilus sp. Marseille-Q4582]